MPDFDSAAALDQYCGNTVDRAFHHLVEHPLLSGYQCSTPSRRKALRAGPLRQSIGRLSRHPDRAARYFAIPAIVAQSMLVELQTREQVREFNDKLPCGARLLEVQHDGRYVVGTFRLTERAGRSCTTAGQLVRVAFVIRARHFTEWRQVPDRPGAPPGPDEPEEAPPPGGPGPA